MKIRANDDNSFSYVAFMGGSNATPLINSMSKGCSFVEYAVSWVLPKTLYMYYNVTVVIKHKLMKAVLAYEPVLLQNIPEPWSVVLQQIR